MQSPAFLIATILHNIEILYPLVYFFGENGILAVQALADVLSLALAIPIAIAVIREIKQTRAKFLQENHSST